MGYRTRLDTYIANSCCDSFRPFGISEHSAPFRACLGFVCGGPGRGCRTIILS